MTIWVSRELPLFNFKGLDILMPESDFRVTSYDHLNFSITFVVQFRASRYSLRVNRTSVWQVMTIWISRGLPLFNFKLLDILCAWIRLPFQKLWPYEFLHCIPCDKLWPFEFLDSIRCSISSVSIYYALESDFRVTSYDHLNLSRASVVRFRASRYIMRPNRTSVWEVMTIWISREHSLFNFERLDRDRKSVV